ALRKRAVALLQGLSVPDRGIALELIANLIHADGGISPAELQLQHELTAVVQKAARFGPNAKTIVEKKKSSPIVVEPAVWKDLVALTHPLLDPLEHTLSPHPVERQSQIEWDYRLLQAAMLQWDRQRRTGNGRLAGITDIGQLPAGSRFLDQFVHVMRPSAPVELIVLGDLHGCYSCLKAALLQTNFVERVWAHQWDPANHPDVKLVLLGDYIDRGRFSFDGVLRAALHLFVAMPDNVIVLRGNHEWWRWWQNNQISSAVYPAEGIASIAPYVPVEMLEAYRVLFESMPTSFLCERMMFVHAGIPRDDTFAERYHDLSSLNDPEIRFQMMWSDPVQADSIPVDIQRQNPRFEFGRAQYAEFMKRAGMNVMVRGHEQIDAGFEVFYDLGEHVLLDLFSAGGHDNADLPIDSSYRTIRPMGLSIMHGEGTTPVATPWPLHYQPFNYAPHNGLYRVQPVLEYRYL
ncbi:MAG TPA: metallophosphoesterase family protein, partial [Kofleriaceae bacterium]|nr:metallophosphoesterase family protein [Kofleriaceae bacterium]